LTGSTDRQTDITVMTTGVYCSDTLPQLNLLL